MTPAPLVALARGPASAPALAWPGGQLRLGELRARVEGLASRAAMLGTPGTPLAVVSTSRVDLALGVLAALRLGRPALTLDPAHPDFAVCMDACAPGGVLEGDAFRATSCGEGGRAEEFPGGSHESRQENDVALLVPTSGTGGTTRVAMLSAGALDAHVRASAASLPPLSSGDRWLVCLPMHTIGALAALWRTLTQGACLCLLERFDPGEARRMMAEGTSHVSVVPAMLEPLAGAGGPPPRDLRCLLSGGGPLSVQAAGAALEHGWPLWNAWGMTESTSHVAAGPVDASWRAGIVGRPLPGAVLTFAAEQPIVISGPMLMSGYASPGSRPGSGLDAEGRFVSSDLGEWMEDGRLRMLGRADDVIVTGGVNVHPQTVEEILSGCSNAGETAVTGRPDARWGQVLVAMYTGGISPAALEAWARERLPAAWRPREFLKIKALPRNAMGKLLRGELLRLSEKTRSESNARGRGA